MPAKAETPVPAPPVLAKPSTAVPPAPAKGDPGGAGQPTGMFEPPPAHAPKETTQPLDPGLIATQAEKAALHEKELAPLKFALDKATAAAAGAQAASSVVSAVEAHKVVTAVQAAPPHAPAGSHGADPPASHQPAASNTDSPSRGVPKPIADPGKQITGGWGVGGQGDGGFEPQYYALDGTELLALIRTIWDSLQKGLDNDLRFGIAAVYPQVAARVTIEIGGSSQSAPVNDVAFNIESRVYHLSGVRVDDNQTPADALRVEADLDRPYKRIIKTPTGTFIVDREAPNVIQGDKAEDL